MASSLATLRSTAEYKSTNTKDMELLEPRNISGVYLRFQNPDTGKWENRVFEDLPEEKQNEWIDKLEPEAVKNLAKSLGKSLRSLADQFDIISF